MPDTQRSPQMEISTGIAQVYKHRYGRGPRRITAHVHDDAVVCLLLGVNTPALNALVRYGKIDTAQVVHAELQMGMAPEMSAVVERVTGRTVVAYVPGFNARADATTDTFVLEALDTGVDAEAGGTAEQARTRTDPVAAAGPALEPGLAEEHAPGPEASGPGLIAPGDEAPVVAALGRLAQVLRGTSEDLHRLVDEVARLPEPPGRPQPTE